MAYTPDPRQRLQAATRFFARLSGFDLECPHCGKVYQITANKKQAAWDPRTGVFSCDGKMGCGKRYILGLLAWPIAGAPRVASQTPEDQVPGPRQLAQLRREGGGWWLRDEQAQRFARPDTTNLTLEEDRPDDEDPDE